MQWREKQREKSEKRKREGKGQEKGGKKMNEWESLKRTNYRGEYLIRNRVN